MYIFSIQSKMTAKVRIFNKDLAIFGYKMGITYLMDTLNQDQYIPKAAKLYFLNTILT
jgi:hypothetical protein